ncbi:FAD/NAD(P)-dependent oxidoreductase [Burkholderia plantarii]|uniref:FAD/NAD(P)-dependent oxidoreductase n=1 Tax=Burkholderia plantarii TaxID=41899 RepID=UPI0018DCBC38|nr:NAD(P)/FAD-dependent oxidoreductase [Burkholderia plantarii]MBI0329472.1 FAD-dependent oxidoreductase [Burkholderia plantarii]
MNEAVDIAVIGAGPAGMSAALNALSLGASVRVLDEQATAGGQIYRNVLQTNVRRAKVLGADYAAGATLAARFVEELGQGYLPGASVWLVEPSPDGHRIHYTTGEGGHTLTARCVIHCGGAQERPFPVPGWTLPGVMTAGAAQVLLKQDGCVPSEPVVLAGSGPLLYLVADQFLRAGVRIRAVLDTTARSDWLWSAPLLALALAHTASWTALRKGAGMMLRLRRAGVEHVHGVRRIALRAGPHGRVASIEYAAGGRAQRIETSLALLHQGVVPNTQFSRMLGAEHRWDPAADCWVPATDAWGELAATGVFLAGDGRGIVGAQAAAIQGRLASLAALSRTGRVSAADRDLRAAPDWRALAAQTALRPWLTRLYRARHENRVPADGVVVCRCEDVDAAEIRLAVSLGCMGPNQVKAFTRCGMGPCQGTCCGLTVTELLAGALHTSPAAVGAFNIRPPLKRVRLSQLIDPSDAEQA